MLILNNAFRYKIDYLVSQPMNITENYDRSYSHQLGVTLIGIASVISLYHAVQSI